MEFLQALIFTMSEHLGVLSRDRVTKAKVLIKDLEQNSNMVLDLDNIAYQPFF